MSKSNVINKPVINLFDGDFIRFSEDGQQYACLIHQDKNPIDPRQEDDGIFSHMMCWHKRYSLGDSHSYDEPCDLWKSLAQEYVSIEYLEGLIRSGETNLQIACEDDSFTLIDTHCYDRNIFYTETESELFSEANKEDILAELDYNLCVLMQETGEVAALPIYLLDHSGLAMSVKGFGDPWDYEQVDWIYMTQTDGQVGWIYMTQTEFLKNTGYTAEQWPEKAVEMMQAEVKMYDQYLENDVYELELFQFDEGTKEWKKVETYGDFYGSDIMENGVVECVSGLADAIVREEYKTGKAIRNVTVTWSFD